MHRTSTQSTVYDGNAYTITSTYHDGQLKMYTTHPTAGPVRPTGARLYRQSRHRRRCLGPRVLSRSSVSCLRGARLSPGSRRRRRCPGNFAFL
jgi:hypothetical protein